MGNIKKNEYGILYVLAQYSTDDGSGQRYIIKKEPVKTLNVYRIMGTLDFKGITKDFNEEDFSGLVRKNKFSPFLDAWGFR